MGSLVADRRGLCSASGSDSYSFNFWSRREHCLLSELASGMILSMAFKCTCDGSSDFAVVCEAKLALSSELEMLDVQSAGVLLT